MKYYLAIIICSLSFKFCNAQSNPEDKLGAWYIYFGTHRISDKLSINTGTQFWLYEPTTNFNLFIAHTGLNYHINPKITASMLYCYLDIDSDMYAHETHTFENRLLEQICYNHTLFNIPIDHQLRAEQRFLNAIDKNITKHRLRYRIGTTLTLNKTLFVRINNEFIGTFKDDTLENRFYTALGINLTKSNNIQLGYLNQEINSFNLHRLQIGIYIKTDHRKKKTKV